ncbi:NAD-dependent epimerase/dehydratase family protein [Marinifilum flexuosum]|uniref:UDP-glucose 4-epimerase n=1 Tax=Marinifilum flexuosum TaxID=1117708 RepID=A0A419XAL4_9BACT|nr:NAD-dependent epimerase/dehydratase family protein [Marinifilum flexuosum]RKE04609.1 UDP-glucose 4-epimerase [Marinifilum flexuosum]
MKSILIIGGDSFIAGKFIKEYSGRFNISAISRVNTGIKNEVVVDNLFEIDQNYFNNIDVVINFAAIVHRPEISDEDFYDRVNYKLPVHIASIAKKKNVQQFIQMSTVAVYGETSLIKPDSNPSPKTAYGCSKLKADITLRELENETFRVVSLRPPMVYGGGLAPGNLMKLISLVNKGIPLPFGEIKNARSFVHVNNLVGFISKVIANEYSGIYFPVDEKNYSTTELIVEISKRLNKRIWNFKLPLLGQKLLRAIKPSLYSKLWGNQIIDVVYEFARPKYDIVQGIEEMVNSYLKKNK